MLLHRLCSDLRGRRVALLACAAVSFFPFSYVLSTNYSEGLFLLASLAAFTAARSRRPALAFAARPRRRSGAPGGHSARDRPGHRRRARAGAAACGARGRRGRRRGRRRSCSPTSSAAATTGSPACTRSSWAGSARRASSTRPGELARYIRDAITLGHAQNLLYLTGVPLAAIGLVVLWRHGIRDGMFVYAVIAVVRRRSRRAARCRCRAS